MEERGRFGNPIEEPLGVEFRTRLMPDPPALRWPLFIKNGVLVSPGSRAEVVLVVDVPVEEIRVELRGSIASDGTPMALAMVRVTRLRLADVAGARSVAKALKAARSYPTKRFLGSGDLYVVAEAFSRAIPRTFYLGPYVTVVSPRCNTIRQFADHS